MTQPTTSKKVNKRPEVPMSEDRNRFREDWGPQECINELLRLARIDPERIVTRNIFRNQANCSEATWNQFFGTFEEFKRQSGVKLTRYQHAHEKAIAKHASVEHYKELADQRKEYGEKYLRDGAGRYRTILLASDLHDKEADPFFLRVFLDSARRIQPETISLVGDVFDLAEFGKYPVDPREWDAVGRIRFVHDEILHPLREACPDAQMDLIEGNHEARLLRLLADATPALRAVLADLHGMSIGSLLGLDRFEVNYVAQGDLATFTQRDMQSELRKNYRVYHKTLLAHHFPEARQMGMPGVNGHHHKHEVWSSFNPTFGPHEWHQMGCGHRRDASYCNGEKWHMGFAIAHVDTVTRASLIEYVPVTDFACVGGKFYHRREDEMVNPSPIAAFT